MNFISDDKKTINLPVPLGSTVYYYLSDCGDFCLHQNEKFKKAKEENPDLFGCFYDAACHTKEPQVQSVRLTLDNIKNVLSYWNDWYFATHEEAEKKAQELKNRNREIMLSKGFKLNNEGYSSISRSGATIPGKE